MVNDLLKFDIPQLYNPYDMSDIHCNLESLAMAAFYIAADAQEELSDMITIDFDINEYDPEIVYEKSYDELIEVVEGYNYYINENKLNYPHIKLAIDYEKSKHLNGADGFPIYKVVSCDGLI